MMQRRTHLQQMPEKNTLDFGRRCVVFLLYLWLLPFFFFAFLLIVKVSFSEPTIGLPPYAPIVQAAEEGFLTLRLYLGNIADIWQEPLYAFSFFSSLKLAFFSTVLCLLLGYPMAYAIANAPVRYQVVLLLLVLLPFWTSFLLRVYAWIGILSPNGLVNNVLKALGVIENPLPLLHNQFSVLIGMVYCYLPFMVLPLYVTLEKMDREVLEAAKDLGCRPFKAFMRVTIPLSKSGIISGCMLVFIPAVGEFVIPALLGGYETLMVGNVLWDEFFRHRDWTMAAMLALGLLCVLSIPLYLAQRYNAAEEKESA